MSQQYSKQIPIDLDPTLVNNSDFLVPSQKAIKTYIANNGGSAAVGNVGDVQLKGSTGSLSSSTMNFSNATLYITGSTNITGNVSAATFYGNINWSYITSKPTTVSGYGITDVYTTAQTNSNFLSANTFLSPINTNGINNTGNITASTYYGDGSNLSGVQASFNYGLANAILNGVVLL